MKTAVIAGATGLVGKDLLGKLLASARYTQVVALTRAPLEIQHDHLTNVVADFSRIDEALEGIQVDDVFCCLGTTMAKAGSKEKFYEVDFHYPLNLAKASLRAGARQYLLVSAVGADKHSRIFYNRVKGETEEEVRNLEFETVHIFRPSLLLGARTEKRPGEDTAKLLYKVFSPIIPAKYKGVEAAKVANAMIGFATRDTKGIFIHESREIQSW